MELNNKIIANKEEILKHDSLYLLMYAVRNEKNYPNVEDVIINPKVDKNICFTIDGKGFCYFWGMFDSDNDYHEFSDYGKTWAYTKEELINYWK